MSWSLDDLMNWVLLAQVPGLEPVEHSKMEAGTFLCQEDLPMFLIVGN